jgi:hypothetical protein
MYNNLLVLREGERTKERRKHVKQTWMEMLRNAKQVPIINVESVQPARIMQGYIARSKSTYVATVISCWIRWKADGRLSPDPLPQWQRAISRLPRRNGSTVERLF